MFCSVLAQVSSRIQGNGSLSDENETDPRVYPSVGFEPNTVSNI